MGGTNLGMPRMLTLTSGGGPACQRRKSLRWRALARLSAICSVSTFGGRRRGRGLLTRLPVWLATAPVTVIGCSCFAHYLVKQNLLSRFCFFELRFFGKRVNPVSRQAFRGRGASGKRAAQAFKRQSRLRM